MSQGAKGDKGERGFTGATGPEGSTLALVDEINGRLRTVWRRSVVAYCSVVIGLGIGYAATKDQFNHSQQVQDQIAIKSAEQKAQSISQRCELTRVIIDEARRLGVAQENLLEKELINCEELSKEAEQNLREARVSLGSN